MSDWAPRMATQNSGYGPLRDQDAEHLEFTVDARRTPQRIGSRHPLDQLANLEDSGGPPRTTRM